MDDLRNKFLKNIDDFFKENPQEEILTPICTLLGAIMLLLNRFDFNHHNKFEDEILQHTEKMLNDNISFFKKISMKIQ